MSLILHSTPSALVSVQGLKYEEEGEEEEEEEEAAACLV